MFPECSLKIIPQPHHFSVAVLSQCNGYCCLVRSARCERVSRKDPPMLEFVGSVELCKSHSSPRRVLARSIAFQSPSPQSPVASRSSPSSALGSCEFLVASNRFDAPECRVTSGISCVSSVGRVRVSSSVASASGECALVSVASAPDEGAHGPKSILARMFARSRRAAMREMSQRIASRLADIEPKVSVALPGERVMWRMARGRVGAQSEIRECVMPSVSQLKRDKPSGRHGSNDRCESGSESSVQVSKGASVGEWRAIGEVMSEAMRACATRHHNVTAYPRAVH